MRRTVRFPIAATVVVVTLLSATVATALAQGASQVRAGSEVAVANEFGSTAEVHGRRIPVRIPGEQLEAALQQDVGYALDVVVGGGRQRVAVLVRDEISLVTSTVTVELEDGRVVEAVARRASDGLEDEAPAPVVDDAAEGLQQPVAENPLELAEGARGRQAVGVEKGRRHLLQG